jgi:hypothetical protein
LSSQNVRAPMRHSRALLPAPVMFWYAVARPVRRGDPAADDRGWLLVGREQRRAPVPPEKAASPRRAVSDDVVRVVESGCFSRLDGLVVLRLRERAKRLVQHQNGVLESLDARREQIDRNRLPRCRQDRFVRAEFADPLYECVANGLHGICLSGSPLPKRLRQAGTYRNVRWLRLAQQPLLRGWSRSRVSAAWGEVVAGCGALDQSPNQPAPAKRERRKHVLATRAPHVRRGSGPVVILTSSDLHRTRVQRSG